MEDYIVKMLFENQDLGYRDFHAKLMPTIDKETIIGVRIPVLRKISKQLFKENMYEDFILSLPHTYYEENNVHSFIIEQIKEYDICLREVKRFLPYIDNWATCDTCRPKVFKKHRQELIKEIQEWICSEHEYTVRFGIGMLMVHYLDEDFKEEYLSWVAGIKSDAYYINMMIAWYYATALDKQKESALKIIENHVLDTWVHNKAIQKAIESNRIDSDFKLYLKTLRRR